MASTTIWFGGLLIVLGLGGFVGTGGTHKTALIPAAFGVVLVALGVIARNEKNRKHAMHAAAGISLLGIAGSIRGLSQVIAHLSGAEVERLTAAYAQTAMTLLLAIFLGLCIRSFVAARLTRKS